MRQHSKTQPELGCPTQYIYRRIILFIQNKYTKLYFNLIKTAQQKTYIGYVEVHHIIPKSLGELILQCKMNNKGKIKINNGINCKSIYPSELDIWTQKGWKRGMIKRVINP